MVFTLIVPLSVMIQESFVSDIKEEFFGVKKRRDSFINTEFSLLNPRSLVFFFQVIFVSKYSVLTQTKIFLDINGALEHLHYVFILTTLGTGNNFMCFLLFFGAVSEKP